MPEINFDEYSDEEFKQLIKYKFNDDFIFNEDFEKRVLNIKDILIYQQILIRINEKNIKTVYIMKQKKNNSKDIVNMFLESINLI